MLWRFLALPECTTIDVDDIVLNALDQTSDQEEYFRRLLLCPTKWPLKTAPLWSRLQL
jgi:hypothetical protein